MAPFSSEIQTAQRLLEQTPRLLVISGIEPDLPTASHQANPPDLASPEAFARDPLQVWTWYQQQQTLLHQRQPSVTQQALAELAQRQRTLIVTLDNSGLQMQAMHNIGADPSAVLELHGNVFELRCDNCQHRWHLDSEAETDSLPSSPLPLCPQCHKAARPNVVWLGEAVEQTSMAQIFCAAELAGICLLINAGDELQPTATIAAMVAQEGGEVIEINAGQTELTPLCSVHIDLPAAQALPTITARS